ncbi:tetratricopeptide repeat protein [Aquimarina sp. 2-A2]|uniref:tetratricopeptide repeat protein n=1 Tax=Aquimarina sp. 2-A2 TaxID=3382644 RepID=UPI00387F12C9
MKKISIYISIFSLLISCTDNFKDATDFTTVTDPSLTESAVLGTPNSSQIWLSGLERNMSITLNEILILAELGSDNYENTQTFYNQFLDGLEIRIDDPDMRDTQFQIAEVRNSAQYGLTTIGPNDPEYKTTTEAEYHFFEGMSYLFAGMYFSALPQEPLGAPVSSAENLASAITSLDLAIDLNPKPEYYLAKARANYYLGNKAEARTAAQNALSLDDDFLRGAQYDQKEGPVNRFESALYQRATFDDFQPLPTLDFLDPKYSFLDPELDQSVYYLKAEEAHLILAEANLSDNNALAAQSNMENLLTLVDNREVRSINDSVEDRDDNEPGSRPDSADIVVNGRTDLVLSRKDGLIDVPSISGTSLELTDIPSITATDAGLELLYRTRQEIFIAEGLRFVDMGIKLVIFQEEISLNPNISEGDASTVKVVPSFIAAVADDLDAFTYDKDAKTVETTINVNEILVDNKGSEQVLPFH